MCPDGALKVAFVLFFQKEQKRGVEFLHEIPHVEPCLESKEMPAVNHSAKLITTLRAALVAHAAIASQVAERIYGGRAPQGSDLPRIIFHEIASNSEHQHDSATNSDPGTEETIIQFDCEGRTLSAARAVADAIAEALNGAIIPGPPAHLQGCFKEGNGFVQPLDIQTGDGITEAHRLSVDYRILWRDS